MMLLYSSVFTRFTSNMKQVNKTLFYSLKFTAFIILFLSFSLTSYSQESYPALAIKARTESKPILIVFSGSDWCAGCIRFKDEVLNTTEFEDFADQNFVLYIADFPRDAENQDLSIGLDNEALASKWNKHGVFPRVILLDQNEKLLKDWQSGFSSTVEMLKWYKS